MSILEFQGENRWLSNFAPVNVKDGSGLVYPSVEHAYQACKSHHSDVRMELLRDCKTAGQAKRFGRTIQVRSDWESVKLEVMEHFLRQKFAQSPYKEKLLATGNDHLEEGNRWGDRFWGVCHGVGENHLGKLIMKIRGELRHDCRTI
jgi:N-glycosidase YbiA